MPQRSAVQARSTSLATPPVDDAVGRLLRAGTVLAIAAALVSGAASARPGDWLAFDLNPSGEGNIFAWASTVAAFGAALAAALHALVFRARRRLFAALAAICAFLSLDDMATVHERLGAKVFDQWLGLPDYLSGQLEITLYAPLFASALVILWTLSREEPRRIAATLVAGVALLVFAVACEFVGVGTRRLADEGVTWVNEVRIAVEEAAELSGWILVATALAAVLLVSLARLATTPAAADS
jgi:hypothetical protein